MNTDIIESERKEDIFYGDIFKINGYGCLIFGHGKTKAARSAIEEDKDEIALDCACLTKTNNSLYGHFDLGVRHKNVKDGINERVKIDYLIRMLNLTETSRVRYEKKLEILEVDFATFINIAEFNITYNSFVSQTPVPVFDKSIIGRFSELVENCDIKKHLIVPWMDSHLEKGKLLKDYISKDSELF